MSFDPHSTPSLLFSTLSSSVSLPLSGSCSTSFQPRTCADPHGIGGDGFTESDPLTSPELARWSLLDKSAKTGAGGNPADSPITFLQCCHGRQHERPHGFSWHCRSVEIFRCRTEQIQQLCVIEAHSQDLFRTPYGDIWQKFMPSSGDLPSLPDSGLRRLWDCARPRQLVARNRDSDVPWLPSRAPLAKSSARWAVSSRPTVPQ